MTATPSIFKFRKKPTSNWSFVRTSRLMRSSQIRKYSKANDTFSLLWTASLTVSEHLVHSFLYGVMSQLAQHKPNNDTALIAESCARRAAHKWACVCLHGAIGRRFKTLPPVDFLRRWHIPPPFKSLQFFCTHNDNLLISKSSHYITPQLTTLKGQYGGERGGWGRKSSPSTPPTTPKSAQNHL